MSRHHEQLLRRLCHNEPTLLKAKAILHTASLKTTPGSGYELGQGASGLPAICAYIAAEELGDDDIDEKSAQVASCLKPKVFVAALHTVRSALAAAAAATSPTKRASRTITYKQLLDDAHIGRKNMVTSWMNDAERTLMDNREMRRRFKSAYDTITLAVFGWVCGIMETKKVKVLVPQLLAKHNIPRDQFDEVTDALHEVCTDVAKNIQDKLVALKAESRAPKPRPAPVASPTKATEMTIPPPLAPPSRSLSLSPSKSSMRAPSAGLTPMKTPSHKRKVAFDNPIPEEDEEFDITATPSKRQKLSSPSKPFPSTPAALTTRISSRLADVSAARAAQQAAAQAASEQPTAGPSTPRRPRVATSQPSSTHSSRSRSKTGSAQTTPSRKGKARLPTVHEEPVDGADRPLRRRCRPVFADQQQWLKGDSRLERELKPWVQKWRDLVRSAGGDVWKAAGMVEEGAAARTVAAA